MAKQLNTRIQHKYDKKENWDNATFSPLAGELIIYSDGKEGNSNVPAFKVGDGSTRVGDLPFISSGSNTTADPKEPTLKVVMSYSTNYEIPLDTTNSEIFPKSIGSKLQHTFSYSITDQATKMSAYPSKLSGSSYPRYHSVLDNLYVYTAAGTTVDCSFTCKNNLRSDVTIEDDENGNYSKNTVGIDYNQIYTDDDDYEYVDDNGKPVGYYEYYDYSTHGTSRVNLDHKLLPYKISYQPYLSDDNYKKLNIKVTAQGTSYPYSDYILSNYDVDNLPDLVSASISDDGTNNYTVYIDIVVSFEAPSWHWVNGNGPCLIEGTLITMADGSQKPIEEVKSGELILSYNPNTQEQTTAIVIDAYKTGRATDFDIYTFSDGNCLTVYGSHGAYDVGIGIPFNLENITRGNLLLNINGEKIKYTQKTDRHYHGAPKSRYNIVTSNNLYYANNVLLGNSAYVKVEFMLRRGLMKFLPTNVKTAWKQDIDEYNAYSSFKNDPQFNMEAKELLRKKALATSIINNNKKRLTDTDYKTQKFIEGALPNEDFEKFKLDRATWRKNINDQENIMIENKKAYEDLVKKYRNNASPKTIFNSCCKRDNEMFQSLLTHIEEQGYLLPEKRKR